MKHHKQSLPQFLDHSFARFRALPEPHVKAACARVLQRLREEAPRQTIAALSGLRHIGPRWRWGRRVAATCAALIIVVLAVVNVRNSAAIIGANAVVKTGDGLSRTLLEGEILRTADSDGVVFSLADTSRVEVRSMSELSLERAVDGVRIRLGHGAIIVNAVSRSTGSLYVKTKDLTVAVTGTVFLVNAEEAGSRVAVIQGEVRVQQATTDRKLVQGEQLATNSSMKSQPLTEQIGWSRNAAAHLEQLEQPQTTLEELFVRCGAQDLRSIVRENGGWNLRLPGFLWQKYKCKQGGDEQ
jgi:ferric-dicitrate binding protein FerR (iron transport regulator)